MMICVTHKSYPTRPHLSSQSPACFGIKRLKADLLCRNINRVDHWDVQPEPRAVGWFIHQQTERNSSKLEQLEELEVSIGLNATTATIIKIGMVWSIQERWRSALPAQSIPKQSGIALKHLETTKTWTLRRTGPSHKIIYLKNRKGRNENRS